MTIYHRKDQTNKVEMIKEKFLNEVIKISKSKVEKPEIIYDILGN